MSANARTGIRMAGTWLTLGAAVWVVSIVAHPPPPPDVQGFMALVAETGTRWIAVHWGAAVALSAFVVTSLIVLSANTRLSATALGMTGWAVLPVASLWVLTTAVAEATVISEAATAGDTTTFEAWHHFAEGKAMGFMGIALSIVAIAANEARAQAGATPSWAAWIAVAAGSVGFVGWILGPIAGVGIGGLLFVLSSVVFGLWLVWFGVGLVRMASSATHDAQKDPRSHAVRRSARMTHGGR